MSVSKKIGICIGALLIVSLLYNTDAIFGAIKFKRLCKTEGGERFYIPVEQNAGWMVEDHRRFGYYPAFAFKPAFVRYENEKGEKFDVVEIIPRPQIGERYKLLPVDESKAVHYLYRIIDDKNFEGDERFSKTQKQIIDVRSNKIVATNTNFGFEWTKPERVILAAPTGVGCFDDNPRGSHESFVTGIFKEHSK